MIESKTEHMYQKGKKNADSSPLTANNYAGITFFAQQKDHLPNVNRIGDIIRLQKVKCKEFRGQKQFNCNVYANKSEWAVFRGYVTDK